MNPIFSIFRFLVYSNLWIAFAAALLATETYLLVGLPLSKPVFWLVFCCTLFTYNFQRIVRFGPKKHVKLSERHQWIEDKHDYLIVLAVLSFAGMLSSLFMVNLQLVYLLIPLGIISLGYVLTIFGSKQKHYSLRDIPSMKIIFIATTWAGATVTLPLFEQFGWEVLVNSKAWLLFAERFIFIMAITIPFDVRDLGFDDATKKTIPQLMGTKKALQLATGLMVISLLIAFFRNWEITPGFIGLIVAGVITTGLILLSNPKRKELFYTGWMDGTMVLQFLCVWLSIELF